MAQPPRVLAERCVHARLAEASCTSCVDACPNHAWTLNDARLGIEVTRCDGCGLCVPACPQEALRVETMPEQAVWIHGHYAFAACERATAYTTCSGVLPCVHALGLRALAALAARGLKGILISTGECGSCARGGTAGIAEALSVLNVLLQSRGRDRFTLQSIAITQWPGYGAPAALARPAQPDRARRGFLIRLAAVRPVADVAASNFAEPKPATPASARLSGRGEGLAEWRPELEPASCEACNACVRVCPAGSLTLHEHERQTSYRCAPDLCTGCGLCRDVCPAHALRLEALGPAIPYVVELERRSCRACGVEFHVPSENGADLGLCTVCRRVNHPAKLFQILR